MNDNDSEDEKRVTFGCPTHSASLLSEMNKRRATDYDIEIAADGKLFQVHKLVLLAESPYFEAMFNSGMREAQSQMIELSDISHHIMEVLIEFMYTSKVSVTANNVYELLHAADLLQMVKVRDFCTNYLVKMLTVANCFSMLDVGKMYSNDPLVNQIVKYISLNLETISDTKDPQMFHFRPGEMKEAISVYCRIKPAAREGKYEVSNEGDRSKLEVIVPRLDQDGHVNNKTELHRFKFNHVFPANAYQDQVFNKVAVRVIDNCLSGYNGTIFAYGQTGSGKTFTVTGGAERYADRGLIPRTLSYLFEKFASDHDFEYKLQVSYLELYNENGYDLLDPLHDIKQLEDLTKVTVLEDQSGGIKIRNLSTVNISNEEEAINQLFIGDTNRSIAETPMNQASTRGHCIFTIYIEARQPGNALIKRSKLHLVDLAGSERIGKSGVSWDSQIAKEGVYINLSLHHLEQVIVALSEKKRDHIPYRNSILTSVLRDSLGGNSITSMITAISLETKNVQESIASCRFSQRVALIKNEAILNEELDPSLQIQRLKREVLQLKEQLEMAGHSAYMAEPITDTEKHDIEHRINQFLKDPDPEVDINLDGDMRKINFVFKRLKKMINLGGGASQPNQGVMNFGDDTSDKEQIKQFQITPDELIRLKEILEQRDTEIAVLTQLLKKERRKPRQVQYDSAKYSETGEDRRTPSDSQTTSPSNQLSKVSNGMSEGRKAAFERFRNEVYVESGSYRQQKSELTDLIHLAKAKGGDVQKHRAELNKLKGEISHLVQQIAVRNATGHGDATVDDREAALRAQMDVEKKKYQENVTQLKQIKPQVDHLQHSLEKQRIEMHRQFDIWFKNEANAALTNSGHDSSSSRPSSSVSKASRTLPVTGDDQADSDIRDFIAARQRVLHSRQAAS